MRAVAVAVLLVLLAGCATTQARKTGGLYGVAAAGGEPAGPAEQAAREAIARFEKRRPYLAGEVFHTLDPIPLVVFVDDPFGIADIEPFAGGTGPMVEYHLLLDVLPPGKDETAAVVQVKLRCRYDTVEGDAGAYDAALRAFRDRILEVFVEELKRAGDARAVEWKNRNL